MSFIVQQSTYFSIYTVRVTPYIIQTAKHKFYFLLFSFEPNSACSLAIRIGALEKSQKIYLAKKNKQEKSSSLTASF